MPKISPEMTMRDITAAVHRGDLQRRDPAVQAALTERLDEAREAYRVIVALVEPDAKPPNKAPDVATLSRAGDYIKRLREDPEKLALAQGALRRIDDTLGSSLPCPVCFQLSESPP